MVHTELAGQIAATRQPVSLRERPRLQSPKDPAAKYLGDFLQAIWQSDLVALGRKRANVKRSPAAPFWTVITLLRTASARTTCTTPGYPSHFV